MSEIIRMGGNGMVHLPLALQKELELVTGDFVRLRVEKLKFAGVKTKNNEK